MRGSKLEAFLHFGVVSFGAIEFPVIFLGDLSRFTNLILLLFELGPVLLKQFLLLSLMLFEESLFLGYGVS